MTANGRSRGLTLPYRLDQDLGRNAQNLMQSTNHRDGQTALAGQNLRDPSAGSNYFLQVLSCQPLLFHPEPDGFDWVWRVHRKIPFLVCRDQGREHVKPVALRRARTRAPKLLNLGQGRLMVRFSADWFDFSRHAVLS